MEAEIVSWLNLLIRWFHIIAGIAWIGSSFYFIWLNNSLKAPLNDKDIRDGVSGELWAVHGGGFYHKKKYMVAPDHMPEDLHWFKWEAYATWTSGFLLLCLMYYFQADLYLIDPARMALEPAQATAIGLMFLAGGWVFYDALCKSPVGDNNLLFGIVWFAALTAASWALSQIFTGRGAYIHTGAIIGTAMAANVFVIIIPNQKKVVKSLLAGEKPDPRLGKKAGQRSLHNNYMTLPAILTMIGSHYPMLTGSPYNWLILSGLAAASCVVRHFFNLKHGGKENYAYLLAGFTLFILITFLTGHNQAGTKTGSAVADVSNAEVRAIITARCSGCHSDTPTNAAVAEAPLGVMYDKMEEIIKNAPRIHAQAVAGDAMPPGNETGMTDEERQKLGAWIEALEKTD